MLPATIDMVPQNVTFSMFTFLLKSQKPEVPYWLSFMGVASFPVISNGAKRCGLCASIYILQLSNHGPE